MKERINPNGSPVPPVTLLHISFHWWCRDTHTHTKTQTGIICHIHAYPGSHLPLLTSLSWSALDTSCQISFLSLSFWPPPSPPLQHPAVCRCKAAGKTVSLTPLYLSTQTHRHAHSLVPTWAATSVSFSTQRAGSHSVNTEKLDRQHAQKTPVWVVQKQTNKKKILFEQGTKMGFDVTVNMEKSTTIDWTEKATLAAALKKQHCT